MFIWIRMIWPEGVQGGFSASLTSLLNLKMISLEEFRALIMVDHHLDSYAHVIYLSDYVPNGKKLLRAFSFR